LKGTIVVTRDNIGAIISHVAVKGRLELESFEDGAKLIRLMRAYRDAVKAMLNHVWAGSKPEEAVRRLYNIIPNYVYLDMAYKQAKLIAESIRRAESETGERILASIERVWVSSRGNRWDGGNRNVKLIPGDRWFTVLIKYPWDGSWIRARAYFGSKYIPLLKELVELSSKRVDGYGVTISLKSRGLTVHVSVPVALYLKHLGRAKGKGYGLVAGFDLNSDRINMVVLDKEGSIVAMRTEHFPEVTSPGYPRDKARERRLQSLAKLLEYAVRIGVDYVAFENLLKVKRKTKRVKSRKGNRKATKFAKRELLIHGILASLRRGFTVLLVNPRGTTNSEEHKEVMRKHGLDKHMASAYIIAYRGLGKVRETTISPPL